MAAIGRFQKDDEIFHAKVVEGELFRLRGDVFGAPSFERKSTPRKGVKTLVPVVPSKIIAVGLITPIMRVRRASRCRKSRCSGSRPPRR